MTASTNFYITGGNVPADALSYVKRDADQNLLTSLLRGEFCYILTSRQMGKSSLMTQMVKRLREHGVAPAVLDLSSQGFNLEPGQWYDGLLEQLGRRLKLEDEIEEFCHDHRHLSPLQRWQQALRQVVLAALPKQQVVIFIDEIDVVRSLPFCADEFFAAIRACYNARTEDPIFARLSFCLLGVTTPADLISNPKLTPFNIGTRIELTDFSRGEASLLEYGLSPNAEVNRLLMDRIYHWTSGHPYLTQRLCQALAADEAHLTAASVDACAERLFLSSKAQRQDSNLLFVQQRMLPVEEEQRVGLLTLYAKVLSSKPVPDSDTVAYVSELKLAGIVQAVKGQLQVRNRIYAQVFDRVWINENMPGAELKRQQTAYRRGLLFAGGLATVVLAMIGSLAFIAVSQANRANKIANRERGARIAADNNAKRAERTAYIANMNLIQREWDVNNVGRVLELLEDTRKSEFRGFEWGYWNRLCHSDLFTLQGHTDRVNAVAFSPDGKHIITGSEDNTLKVWDVATGREMVTLKGHASINSVAFSYNGKRILTGSCTFVGSQKVSWATVQDAGTGKEIFSLKLGGEVVSSVAFSPDGKSIIIASWEKVTIWDSGTGKKILTLKGHTSGAKSVAFSPDSKCIVTGGGANLTNDNTIQVWDAATGREMLILKGRAAAINSVAFSPDGKRIVTGSEDSTGTPWDYQTQDGTTTVWNAMTGNELLTLKGHTGSVKAVAFSPDGKRIVTGNRDHTTRVWDAVTGSEISVLKGHTGSVNAVAFSPDGKRIVTGSEDQTAKVWDVTTEQEALILDEHLGLVWSVAFSPDGKRVVTGSCNSVIPFWDVLGETSGVGHGTITQDYQDKNELQDKTASVWNAISAQRTLTLKGSTGSVYCVAFSPDGTHIVTGSYDNAARVWNAITGREMLTLRGHTDDVNSVAFSFDGKRIITGSKDAKAKVWDAITGRQMLTLNGHADGINSVAISPDGKRIVTGSDDYTAKVWDAVTGREMLTLKGHSIKGRTNYIISVKFSGDGTRIVTGSSDHTAKVWDAVTGREMLTLKGHTGNVYSVAFSPDGTRILTGSEDHTAKIWDATTGNELLVLKGHRGPVHAVTFSPDGKSFATGSFDKTIRIWEALFN